MRLLCLICCLGALLVTAGQAASPAVHVVLWAGDPERPLACLPLEQGSRFYLDFINSIYLAPVRETFVYEPPEGVCVVMVESSSVGVFEYYGLMPDKPGVAHLRRPVGEMRIRSHDYKNHRLTVGETTIYFKGLIKDGEALTIKVGTEALCGV
jgi:hypothetical protein